MLPLGKSRHSPSEGWTRDSDIFMRRIVPKCCLTNFDVALNSVSVM